MRSAFTFGVAVVLVLVMAGKAVVHAKASQMGSISCAQGAAKIRLSALDHGFAPSASNSQAENFMSNCLITGSAQVGQQLAHD